MRPCRLLRLYCCPRACNAALKRGRHSPQVLLAGRIATEWRAAGHTAAALKMELQGTPARTTPGFQFLPLARHNQQPGQHFPPAVMESVHSLVRLRATADSGIAAVPYRVGRALSRSEGICLGIS